MTIDLGIETRLSMRAVDWSRCTSPWTLIHGEALDVLRTIPDAFADALITDEPYSSGGIMRSDRGGAPSDKYYISERYPTFSGDNRDARSWAYWCVLWFSECVRIVKPGGYMMMFADWRQLPLATDVYQSAGGVWRGIIPWDKGPTARAPHTGYARHQCEYIVWGSVGQLESADGRGPFPGIYTVPVDPQEKEHLTGKPVELMRKLARMVPEDGLILDPFAGSSSTGVGALLANRRFLGIEREAAYIDISRPRLERAAAYHTMLAQRAARPERATQAKLTSSTPTGGVWRWRSI